MRLVLPPASEADLLERSKGLIGRTMASIAAEHGVAVPPDLRRHKGWVGDTIERALGAGAGNKQAPDFIRLGVELKTVPLDRHGRPLEATFVTQVAPPAGLLDLCWEGCPTQHKLARLLWVGVDGDRRMPVGDRQVRRAFLWTPTHEQWALIEEDWHELTDLLRMGGAEDVDTTIGEALHCRPKSSTGDRAWAIDAEGQRVRGTRLGFYLRKAFVAGLLTEAGGDLDVESAHQE